VLRRSLTLTALSAAAAGSLLLTTTPALAAHGGLTVTGLTANDRLVTFLANSPGRILTEIKVTGVDGDLQTIDFRPATGELYGVALAGDGARLYKIDAASGAATRVGTAVYPLGGNLSMDFNPAVDRVRLVSDEGTNLRLHPDTGALAFTDGALTYVAGDRNAGSTPRIGGVAYTNNETAATGGGTTLFDIDAAIDQLVVQDPPNAGGLKSLPAGVLPQGTKAQATGFDIYQREPAKGNQTWAFVSLFDKGRTTFWQINLATGAGQTFPPAPGEPASGSQIGTRPHVTDIAVEPAQGV
jgi:hypothetical protein